MAIEVKNLIEQSIALATERRQQKLSDREVAEVKGGMHSNTLKVPINVIGVILRPEWTKGNTNS